MTSAALRKLVNEPLTDNGGHSERCANPFCEAEIAGRKGKRFCSDRCRMDTYVLRRAKEMIDRVGIAEFIVMLKRLKT